MIVACSDYFRAMLTTGMRESAEGKANLQGGSGEGLKAMVNLAYKGTLELAFHG